MSPVPSPPGKGGSSGGGSHSPLLILFAIIAIGIMVEVVERQNRQAAWIKVGVLLLGAVTCNASTFDAQLKRLIASFSGPSFFAKTPGSQNGVFSGRPSRA